jgi:hypothetical protein
MMKVGQRAVDTHHPPFRAPDVVVQALCQSATARVQALPSRGVLGIQLAWKCVHHRAAWASEGGERARGIPMQRRRGAIQVTSWHSGPVDAYRRRRISH